VNLAPATISESFQALKGHRDRVLSARAAKGDAATHVIIMAGVLSQQLKADLGW